jgi:hypothetical protein
MNRRNLVSLVIDSGGPMATGFNFDQGSYSTFAEESTDVYRITPRKHWDSKWAWWALRSGKFAGKTPHFLIAKAAHYGLYTGEWLACWATAADTDTWTNFDNVTIGATDLEFYHNTAFPSGTIYIAAMPMYPLSRTQRKLAEWTANALASSPDSATNYIIGNSTARDNGDARGIIPALPYYGIKFANATANTKNKAILASGNHPSENIGRYMLEGAVDWLLTSGAKQKQLLDWFEFWGYPCLNPQGVYGGWFRSSPETPTDDNNRLWDGTGVNEAVDAFKTAWNTDVSNAADVALDFHSWMEADGNKGLAYDSTTTIWAAYIAAITALDAAYVQRADTTTASLLGSYWRSWDAAKLTGHPDHGGVTTIGPTGWKLAGRRFVEALADMVAAGYFANNPGVGSRDFNGSTDRIDWANVYNPSGQAFTIHAMINPDAVNKTEYILNMGISTGLGIALNCQGATLVGSLQLYISGTNPMFHNSQNNFLTTGAWQRIITTRSATFGNPSGVIRFFRNGTESSYQNASNGSGTEGAFTGGWSMGGRASDDTRNWDGKLAQVAVWNRVLTDAERAQLDAGQAPDTISSGLQFYFKGNTSALDNQIGGADGTADGTTQLTGAGTGPAIIYG